MTDDSFDFSVDFDLLLYNIYIIYIVTEISILFWKLSSVIRHRSRNGIKPTSCKKEAIFSTKSTQKRPKRLKIWNHFENIVPLHCQTEEATRRALRVKIARVKSGNCAH